MAYTVTCERTTDHRRFTRIIYAADEQAALKMAYRELQRETADYYVVSVVPRERL